MSIEDTVTGNIPQDVQSNEVDDLTKVRRGREEDVHVDIVPFPEESDLEGKEVCFLPVNTPEYIKASLMDFKKTFDDSYGSAQLYFDYNQNGVFEALIVADTNEDLQAGKAALEAHLSECPSQSKRQKTETDSNESYVGSDVATLNIPGDAVGLLIGKNGISLRVVEIATGTKITVDQTNKPDGTRSVSISGPSDCVAKAKKEITRIRSAPKDGDQGIAPIGPGAYSPEEIKEFEEGYSKTITIPSNAIKILIGKAGETIRILQIHYGVRISVTDAQDQDAPTRSIVIYGSEDDVKRVSKEIDIICEAEKDLSALKKSELLSNVFEYSDTFTVSPESVGLIIGRKGENIKFIQKSTNSNLQIEQTENPNHPGLRSITITARTEANVKQARMLVDQAITGHPNFRQNMNSKMYPSYNSNPNWMPGSSFDNNMGGMYNRPPGRHYNNFQQRNYQGQGNMGGMNRNFQGNYNPNFMNRGFQQGGGRFNKFQGNAPHNFQNMNTMGMNTMGGMNSMGGMNMGGMNSMMGGMNSMGGMNPMGGMNSMGMNNMGGMNTMNSMSNMGNPGMGGMGMSSNFGNANTNPNNPKVLYEHYLNYYLEAGHSREAAEKSAKYYAGLDNSSTN